MPLLDDVLRPLGARVVARQQMDGNEWLLLLAREAGFPHGAKGPTYIVYSENPNNPEIDEEVAEAIRRRFTTQPPTSVFPDLSDLT